MLESAVSSDPRNASGHYQLGAALMRTGDTTRAETEWREAVRLRVVACVDGLEAARAPPLPLPPAPTLALPGPAGPAPAEDPGVACPEVDPRPLDYYEREAAALARGDEEARHDGLARAGRPYHDHVVAARSGNFHRSFHIFLAPHVNQIHLVFRLPEDLP